MNKTPASAVPEHLCTKSCRQQKEDETKKLQTFITDEEFSSAHTERTSDLAVKSENMVICRQQPPSQVN